MNAIGSMVEWVLTTTSLIQVFCWEKKIIIGKVNNAKCISDIYFEGESFDFWKKTM